MSSASFIKQHTLTHHSLYTGFVESAVIVGDMHIQLFSATAQRGSPQSRAESAKAFAARLTQVNSDSKQVRRAVHCIGVAKSNSLQSLLDGPPVDAMFQAGTILLDIIMHCLMTIVYRIVPCDESNSHPLQCNVGCIGAARQALSTIVHASQNFGLRNPAGWRMFLNL